jgi:hypothetical protein
VWSWGYNYDGELGIGTSGPNANYGVATLITDGYNASHIAASGTHAAMLKRDGTVWGWGYNQFGQVGDGTTTSRSVPVLVSGLSGISDIAVGAIHTLAMKPDGTVWAWGNTSGYAGGPVPMQVNIDHVVSIAGGFSHSLALKSDGTVWAWGINSYGELGNGDTMQVFDPIRVKNLAGVVALAKTSETSSMAISRQVPFAAADAKLTISTGLHAGFTLTENVTLGVASNGINPPNEVFILEVGTYQVIITPGSFKVSSNGRSAYSGTINNVKLDVQINPTSGNTFTLKASANDVWLGNLTNPVTVGLIVGGDLGAIVTTANFN